MNTLKQNICDALAAWIRQRPGLEYGNYVSPGTISREQIESGRRAYFQEARSIARDKRDAETLLATVRWRDSITGEQLIEASRGAFSGRLTIERGRYEGAGKARHWVADAAADTVRIDYCTGQYWPTEYRKAAAAVLASALWATARADMPKANGKVKRISGKGPFQHETEHDNIDGMSPGDWLRKHFRKEYGSRLQRRWFD